MEVIHTRPAEILTRLVAAILMALATDGEAVALAMEVDLPTAEVVALTAEEVRFLWPDDAQQCPNNF